MKKKQKKQKKLLALAALLAVVSLLAGTFAWLTAQDQVINRMEAGKKSADGVKVSEVWNPKPITPGATMKKEVKIESKQPGKVYVRASFEEVLKYLKGKGEEEWTASPYVPLIASATVVEKAGVGRNLAVEIDPADSEYTGYTDITSKFTPAPTITGIKIKAKGSYSVDAASGEGTRLFDYLVYYEYSEDGKTKYQKVDAKVNITSASFTDGDTEQSWTYTLEAPKFAVYKDGFAYNTVNWAASKQVDAAGTDVTGASLLGTEGVRYGNTYNYKNQTNNGLIPDANLNIAPQIATDYPKAPNETKKIQADSVLSSAGLTKIQYDTAITDPTGTLASGKKWVFNPEDGWFYYLQPLSQNEATELLLNEVQFDNGIKKEFTSATYDLIVKTEAVQYANDALTDNSAGGFGLDISASNPISKKIYDVLKQP